MTLNIETFNTLKDFLFKNSGLTLSQDKTYLLESRLGPVISRNDFGNMDELAIKLKTGANSNLEKEVVEAMTTNETSFFRDQKPFTLFEQHVLPYFLEKNKATRKLRIWCAACSSGQEPYTLVMLMKEMGAKLAGWNIEILGTDIDETIIDQARKGEYSQFEVQRGLPINLLMKYFVKEGDVWKISKDITSQVTYKKFNLLDSFMTLGKFDIIFCRNVLIYFERETKSKIFTKFETALNPDGFLFLGGAETVLGITDKFKPYKERGSAYIMSGGTHDS